MKYCNLCGAGNKDDSIFCDSCGGLIDGNNHQYENTQTQYTQAVPTQTTTQYSPTQVYQNTPQYEYGSENQQYGSDYAYQAGAVPQQDYSQAFEVQDYDAMLKKSRIKKIKIASCIFAALVVLLGGAYVLIDNLVYSPTAVVKKYMNMISAGHYTSSTSEYEKSIGLSGFQTNGSYGLLYDNYAKESKTSGFVINYTSQYKCIAGLSKSVDEARDFGPRGLNVNTDTCYKVNVTYEVNGKKVNKNLLLRPSGTDFLIFKKYVIDIGSLADEIKVNNVSSIGNIKVNGENFTITNCSLYDDSCTLYVYSGIYHFTISDKNGDDHTYTVDTSEQSQSEVGSDLPNPFDDYSSDDDDSSSDDYDYSSDDDSSSSDDDSSSDDSSDNSSDSYSDDDND